MTLTFQKRAQGPQVAYLFPGQGAQAVGMGKELYDASPAAREVFQEVDDALGRPLTKVLFEGPEDDLRQTINAQPGIMAVSLACVKAMEESLDPKEMPQPVMMAGHSLGEYTALAVAGVLDVSETARLVHMRGSLMQEACDKNPGTMAAVIGLDQMALEEVARETGVWVSNVNTAEQIVISGEPMGIARAMDLASARGAKKVIQLRVGGAFHSGLMEPAKAGLIEAIDSLKFNDPQVPIIGNCTGKPLTTADGVKQELVSQICSCVQWNDSVGYIIDSGVDSFLEIGPGRALNGMVKRISRQATTANIGDIQSILELHKN
ncbi:MAG: ACP S-malonyltransferase [SAR202 cluster bacterium]|jgi:[acyl-carrier-protein] S-malonyltransferase|nr:[acyl-carrier-protein] S-malonyltransferase [Chloroflexota bacterium]MDP6420988.1 ACP S-malonyltransferase [SAR202 cluster bacterium]HAL49096.1 [acyl-carrier-protein] S-malonyltransferase [Dehalococcoidia bacterium]MDP6664531.1 ACP S-malonyltransferase [SAR202 cluster bacterium]MDP6800186.1 ACP S-malonyltransferase [SAR202 cluster bacterium]|tara:strand:+ start:9223 stop:10182 length:960 start_codon:yes stop_codon:yes gene_type:complete